MMVSLIIPCIANDLGRCALLLEKFLHSTTLMPDEILVSVSGVLEAPELDEIVQTKKTKIRVFLREGTHYAGDNRNYGAKHAKGDILLFQDADDEIHPQKVELVVNFFEKNKNVDVLNHLYQPYGFDWQIYDVSKIEDFPVIEHRELFESKYTGRAGGGGCVHRGHVSVRAQVWKTIKYDPTLRRGQDAVFLFSCLEKFKCGVLQLFLSKYDGITYIPAFLNKMHSDWKKIDEPNGLGKSREKLRE